MPRYNESLTTSEQEEITRIEDPRVIAYYDLKKVITSMFYAAPETHALWLDRAQSIVDNAEREFNFYQELE